MFLKDRIILRYVQIYLQAQTSADICIKIQIKYLSI